MTAFPLRLSLAGILLALNLGAQAAPATPALVTFDTTPRAGQQQRQLIDMQATIKMRAEAGPEATDEQRAKIAEGAARLAQMGAMQMSMQMQQTMKVGQADADGWLPLTVATSGKSGQLLMGGKAMPLPQGQQDLSFTARFNPKDFAVEMQGVEGAPALNEMLKTQGGAMINEALQLSKALSQHPLKVGDSVDLPLAMSLPVPLPGGAGSLNGQVHYTLAKVERGVAYFDLSMDLKVDVNAPLPVPPGASAPAADAPPQTMHMVVNGSGKGTSSLRLADRLPLASKLAMAMQLTLDMPDNGVMRMEMDMLMQSKGDNLAQPATAKPKAPAKADAKKKS